MRYTFIYTDHRNWITAVDRKEVNDPHGYEPNEYRWQDVVPDRANPARLPADYAEPEYGWNHAKIVGNLIVQMDEADEAVRQAEKDAVEAQRIANLATLYGQKVGQLAGLLAVFGLAMPCTQETVAPVCYAAIKADATKSADSQMLMVVYDGLLEYLTDDDIYAIGKVIGVAV